jgi:hypothetical protein
VPLNSHWKPLTHNTHSERPPFRPAPDVASARLLLLAPLALLLGACDVRQATDPGSAGGATSITCTAATGSDLAHVVAEADAFRASLSAAQRPLLELPLSHDNAVLWSNLPVPAVPRVGIRMGNLSAAQSEAAERLLNATLTGCGKRMMDEIRLADDYIKPIIPMFGWDSGNFFIAFVGAPSVTTPWMLKVGGHHLAYNFTFNGRLPGATPLFFGIEPIEFAVNGVQHIPMHRQSSAISALAAAASAHVDAHLTGTFTDVVKGVIVSFPPGQPPVGGNDTGFPMDYPSGPAGRGVRYNELSSHDQTLVRQAIEAYAELPAIALSRPLLTAYESPAALADTYIGYSGSTDLSTNGSYVRVDGPRLWMEFVVQPGVAYPKQMHYHALWRDKQADYGGEVSQ